MSVILELEPIQKSTIVLCLTLRCFRWRKAPNVAVCARCVFNHNLGNTCVIIFGSHNRRLGIIFGSPNGWCPHGNRLQQTLVQSQLCHGFAEGAFLVYLLSLSKRIRCGNSQQAFNLLLIPIKGSLLLARAKSESSSVRFISQRSRNLVRLFAFYGTHLARNIRHRFVSCQRLDLQIATANAIQTTSTGDHSTDK